MRIIRYNHGLGRIDEDLGQFRLLLAQKFLQSRASRSYDVPKMNKYAAYRLNTLSDLVGGSVEVQCHPSPPPGGPLAKKVQSFHSLAYRTQRRYRIYRDFRG